MTADPFAALACYYDHIMAHVEYDRWYVATAFLGGLLPKPFRHCDVACGTGTLIKRLRKDGWQSVGIDISPAMIRTGRTARQPWPAVVGDMRSLPLDGTVDFATCLFDSINFLLSESEMHEAITQLSTALRPGGVLYFDFVTEEMVLQHFAGQEWTEHNGTFQTTWDCTYDRATCLSEVQVRINKGLANTFWERIHSPAAIEHALESAGLKPLAIVDGETWRRPRRKTIRVDVIAVKGNPKPYKKAFRALQKEMQTLLRV